jgi:hypothetical protein
MNRWDVLVAVGVILLAVGAAMISIPAGLIVAGLGCAGFGAAGAWAESRALGGPAGPARGPNGGDQP